MHRSNNDGVLVRRARKRTHDSPSGNDDLDELPGDRKLGRMELARRQQPRYRVAEQLARDNRRQRVGPVAVVVSLDRCGQSEQRRRDVRCDRLALGGLPELDGSAANRSRGLQRSHLGHGLEERNRGRRLGRSRS